MAAYFDKRPRWFSQPLPIAWGNMTVQLDGDELEFALDKFPELKELVQGRAVVTFTGLIACEIAKAWRAEFGEQPQPPEEKP